jgi:hypothetical protein
MEITVPVTICAVLRSPSLKSPWMTSHVHRAASALVSRTPSIQLSGAAA